MKNTIRKWRIPYVVLLVISVMTCGAVFSFAASDTDQNATLTVDQTFQIIGAKPSDLDETCEYTITAVTTDAPMPGGKSGGSYTFPLSNDGSKSDSITFTNACGTAEGAHVINFTKAGEYEYTITPPKAVVSGVTEGYTLDEAAYNIKVSVVNSENGLIVTAMTVNSKADTTKKPAIHYTHKYKSKGPKPCFIDPPVKKEITGDKPDKDATFRFTMKADPGKSILPKGMSKMPMPNGMKEQSYTITIKGEGEREFGIVEFTKPGKYVYQITEEKGSEDGYTYDKSVYTVIAEVTEDANKNLVVKQTNKKGLRSADKAIFTNKYKKNGGNNNNSNDKPGKRWKRGGTGSTARTGDTIRLGLFITIFAVAVLGLIVLLVKRSRRKDESS